MLIPLKKEGSLKKILIKFDILGCHKFSLTSSRIANHEKDMATQNKNHGKMKEKKSF